MISAADMNRLNYFIEEQTGITIPESNYRHVSNFIDGKLAGYASGVEDYLAKVPVDQAEYGRLMEAVTINETYFFREEKQFLALRRFILPKLPEQGVDIWSSSCSSGEEALSLYVLALERFGSSDRFRLFASDINRGMLEKFRRGVYRPASLRTDGSSLGGLLAAISAEAEDRGRRIEPSHLENIRIFENNLFRPAPEDLPQMDIIFLRNTLIYMNPENKRSVIDDLVRKLKTGGCLFLSSSEVPLVSHPSLRVKEEGGVFYFEKEDPLGLSQEVLSRKVRRAAGGGQPSVPERAEIRRYAPPEPAPKPGPDSEDRVCMIVSMKLNNRTFRGSPGPAGRAADLVLGILELAGRNEFERAERLLCSLDRDELPSSIPALRSFFLAGFQHRRNNNSGAERLYREALRANPGLWPAKFFLLRLLPGGHPDRRLLASELKGEIGGYIDSHRWDYQFLLDGFNARYFLMICEKITEDTKRRDYGD